MPSLYESTVNTGEVSSSNFTTLYNASGLQVPNAGAGSVTGNLNVGGNLIVQGTSLLQGAVTLGSTLSTPNYTFPLPDGTTDQVLVTDGSGNLYWTDVSAIPGAAYQIQANTATGGANLTLVDSAGGTDSVKFAGGTNVTVVRTDENTITINTVADNIPDGTAAGEVLVWDGSAWTANNQITSLTAADRLITEFKNTDTTRGSSAIFLRNYASTAYTTGLSSAIAFSFDSDSQAPATQGAVGTIYDAAKPSIFGSTTIDNFTNSVRVFDIDSTDVKFNGTNLVLNANGTGAPSANATITVDRGSSTDATLTWNETTDTWQFTNDALVAGNLAVQGGDVTTTNATGNLFNANAVVVNVGNGATTEVNLGNVGAGRVQIKSPSIVGANTTQAVFNTVATTVNAFGASTATNIGATTGTTTLGNNLDVNGETVRINANNTTADSFLYFKGNEKYLSWNNTFQRFEFNDSLFGSTTAESPAHFERRVTSAEINNPTETKTALRLTERVTDAVSNATDQGGSSILFTKASGTTPGSTETAYGNIGSRYYGTTNTADIALFWSNDNFSEPTPGSFPGTYSLLRTGSNDAEFTNNSLFLNYSALGASSVATSITGGNTLVFPTAHGFTSGERIYYTSTTQNGLTQNTYYYVLAAGLTTTQCRIGLTVTGSAVALTNGTGLNLTFRELINRVGVNTGTPGYTLDVNGDANVSGDIYVSGYQIDINSPAAGQVITFDGTKFINNNVVSSTNGANRFVTEYQNNAAGINAALFVRKNYTTTPFTNGDGTSIVFQVDSDSQAVTSYARVDAGYNTTLPGIGLRTSTDNFATSTLVAAFSTDGVRLSGNAIVLNSDVTGTPVQNVQIIVERGTSTDATLTWDESVDQWQFTNDLLVAGDLAVQGGDVTTTSTTGNLFNANALVVNVGNGATSEVNLGNVGAGRVQIKSPELDLNGGLLVFRSEVTGTPALNAEIRVERGTSTDASLTWDESQDRWEFNNALEVQGQITGTSNLDLNGNNITLRSGATVDGDATITVDRGPGVAEIKWDSATDRWETSVDGSTYLNIPNQNLDTTDNVTFASVTVDGGHTVIDTTTTTTTSTAQTAITTTSNTTTRSSKFQIQVTDNVTGNIHVLEAMLFFQGTTAYLTTYAEMYNSTSLATFAADVSGGNTRLLATAASANNTTFKVTRISVAL